jgi:hypothetical protein
MQHGNPMGFKYNMKMAQHFYNKATLLYISIVLVAFTACKKDDSTAFDKSPDERINETLANYQALLSGAENGWRAVVYPAAGGAYSFYFKFNDANRVVMYSDFDSASAATARESSYRLKALQQPSLIFDTYSYLHLLADPNENTTNVQSDVNGFRGGTLGQGLQSDFEYAIDTATADSVTLTGRQHGTRAFLVKATPQEAAAYGNGQLATALLRLQNIDRILFYFKRLTLGGKTYDVSINDNLKTIAFTWVNAGQINTFNTTYYYTIDGIRFSTPFNDGSQTITGFTGINWNAGTGTFSVTANSNTGTIAGVNSPIAVDKQAPVRWWNYAVSNGNTYWISIDGFHVNGVDDAYGISSLQNDSWKYLYLIYWPRINSGIDFMGPLFLNAAEDSADLFYGTIPRSPTITADGRALFREDQLFGTYPESGPAALTRTQLYNAGGYYFVQTSPISYDMVSAADSRIWITWQQ